MSQKNFRVDAALAERVLAASGAALTHRKGWVNVALPAHTLYLPGAGSKTVGWCTLAGPEVEGRERFGLERYSARQKNRHEMSWASAEQFSEQLAALLAHLLSLPPRQKGERAPRAEKPGAPAGWSAPAQAQRADRLALIRRVAAEKGVAVSPATEALAQ